MEGGSIDRVLPHCVVPCRALENQVFVCYSNYAGAPFCGSSAIIGKDGMDMARADSGTPTVLTARLDLGAFQPTIDRNGYLVCRRPELYAAIASIPGK